MPSPLVLESSAVSVVDAPPDATGLVVEPLHIVAMSLPNATLSDGRPV